MPFSPRILIEKRKKAGMNVPKFADWLKVSPSQIRQWESGFVAPGSKHLENMASILGCRIDDLFESERK